MSKGGWGTAALAVVALLIWQDGCAGKAAVTTAGTGAVVGAGVGAGAAAGSASGAGAAAAGRALFGGQQGKHAAGRTQPRSGASSRPSTVLCPQPDGTMGLCGAAGLEGSSRTEARPGAAPPCDIGVEPRERVLPEQDADGDGQPDRVTLPELGCR